VVGTLPPFLHSSFGQRSPLFHFILSLDVHTILIGVYTLVSRP